MALGAADNAAPRRWRAFLAGVLLLVPLRSIGADAGTTTQPRAAASRGAVAVSVVGEGGNASYCALLEDQTVRCWGNNAHGQLGDGSVGYVRAPVQVLHLADVVALTGAGTGAGYCAQLESGLLRCWGDGGDGQLGDGSYSSSAAPVAVQGLAGTVAVTPEGDGSGYCAISTLGEVRCWGDGAEGELGVHDASSSDSPVAVTGLPRARRLASDGTGYCTVLTDGSVECWGIDSGGTLGNGGGEAFSDVPVLVRGVHDAVDVASNGEGYCALLRSGSLECWGFNHAGELGDGGREVYSDVPVPVRGLTGASSVIGGYEAYCALRSGGAVSCWGSNANGELGDGMLAPANVPVRVANLHGAAELVSGGDGFCVVVLAGTVSCWGQGSSGQLGDGSDAASSVPVRVRGLGAVSRLSSDLDGYCAVLRGGGVSCWGDDSFGELGDGGREDESDVPVAVVGFRAPPTRRRARTASPVLARSRASGDARLRRQRLRGPGGPGRRPSRARAGVPAPLSSRPPRS